MVEEEEEEGRGAVVPWNGQPCSFLTLKAAPPQGKKGSTPPQRVG